MESSTPGEQFALAVRTKNPLVEVTSGKKSAAETEIGEPTVEVPAVKQSALPTKTGDHTTEASAGEQHASDTETGEHDIKLPPWFDELMELCKCMKRPKAYLEEEPTMQMVKFVTILLDNYFNFLIMCRKSRTYDKPEQFTNRTEERDDFFNALIHIIKSYSQIFFFTQPVPENRQDLLKFEPRLSEILNALIDSFEKQFGSDGSLGNVSEHFDKDNFHKVLTKESTEKFMNFIHNGPLDTMVEEYITFLSDFKKMGLVVPRKDPWWTRDGMTHPSEMQVDVSEY